MSNIKFEGENLSAEEILKYIDMLCTKKSVKIYRHVADADWVIDVGNRTYSSPNFNHLIRSAVVDYFPQIKPYEAAQRAINARQSKEQQNGN